MAKDLKKVSGLKLNFTDTGEGKMEVTAKTGETQLPHRLELVQEAFDNKDYERVLEIGTNFSTRGCKNNSSIKQLDEEFALIMKAIEKLEQDKSRLNPEPEFTVETIFE